MRFSFIFTICLALLASCGGKGSSVSECAGDTIALHYARHLTMVDCGEYLKAEFRNPWDTLRNLQTLILVPRDAAMPEHLPEGVVVRVPVERSVVYTSCHNSLICELGAIDAIVGVCDPSYIRRDDLRQRIASGSVADCGNSMAPNIEKILMLRPDALLLSAFENSNDHNKVAQTGIPIIDCPDYMETSPLARAEWMRFFGRLYGKGEKADSLFSATEQAYKSLKEQAGKATTRPTVMTDLIYGQTWSVPGATSTIGVMIRDAGGRNPFDVHERSGGVQLSPEEVVFRASKADIWLIKYAQATPLTLRQLSSDNDIYTRFRPFATGQVYGCNTQYSSYFEDDAFHPHWILAEYVSLFHPELALDHGRRYYSKLLEK